jgi:hypothetical protein
MVLRLLALVQRWLAVRMLPAGLACEGRSVRLSFWPPLAAEP